MICNRCHVGRVAPSNIRGRHYQCAKCTYAQHGRTLHQRYGKTEKGKAQARRMNAKRVYVGERAIYMKTEEQARIGQEHIRQRLRQFREATATEPE